MHPVRNKQGPRRGGYMGMNYGTMTKIYDTTAANDTIYGYDNRGPVTFVLPPQYAAMAVRCLTFTTVVVH